MCIQRIIILGSPNVYPFLLKVFAVHVLLTSHRGHVQATVGSSVGKLVVDSSVGSWVVDSSVGSLVPGCSVLFGQSLLTSLPWQGSSSIRTNSHRVAITHSTYSLYCWSYHANSCKFQVCTEYNYTIYLRILPRLAQVVLLVPLLSGSYLQCH